MLVRFMDDIPTFTLENTQLTEEESDVHYTQGLFEAVEVEKKKTDTQRRRTRHNSTTPWEENMEHLVHPSQRRKFQGL